MSDPQGSRSLPDRPNLRHLKAQAKDLLQAGGATSLAQALFQLARQYGFASWAKLKAHVESVTEVGQLKHAIDRNDLERVQALMRRNPGLHVAPLGYENDGPLTWAAECRVPWGPPSPARLAIVAWMIEHGSDVHRGGDAPLMRAALGDRIPMMELLVAHGADVNALWHGVYPIIYAACESVDPAALKWLLDRGARPNVAGRGYAATALAYVIGSYERSPNLPASIDILVAAGATCAYPPIVVDLLRGDLGRVAASLDEDPLLLHARFPELDFGATGARMLTLRGATLLHVAAEYQNIEAMTFLIDRGADINARATVAASGVGGQTPLFHAATQREDSGLPAVRLLVERGADLAVRARVPGHYERLDETLECTALGYATRFEHEPCRGDKQKTVSFLRERGAPDVPNP